MTLSDKVTLIGVMMLVTHNPSRQAHRRCDFLRITHRELLQFGGVVACKLRRARLAHTLLPRGVKGKYELLHSCPGEDPGASVPGQTALRFSPLRQSFIQGAWGEPDRSAGDVAE